jgi:hypothetical protein
VNLLNKYLQWIESRVPSVSPVITAFFVPHPQLCLMRLSSLLSKMPLLSISPVPPKAKPADTRSNDRQLLLVNRGLQVTALPRDMAGKVLVCDLLRKPRTGGGGALPSATAPPPHLLQDCGDLWRVTPPTVPGCGKFGGGAGKVLPATPIQQPICLALSRRRPRKLWRGCS